MYIMLFGYCTLCVQGFCSVSLGLQRLGLLKDTEHQRLQPDAAPLRWVSTCTVTLIPECIVVSG